MPQTETSIAFSLSATNVSGLSFDADLRLNVKKRIADILYLKDCPPDSVRLSYVGSSEIKASNTLFIGDRSDRIYPNAKNRYYADRLIHNNKTGVGHKEILVTQKFAEGSGTRAPFFYKHVLPAQVSLESIRLLDKNFEELSPDHWLAELIKEYDEDTGQPASPTNYIATYVFNSQENSFNEDTGEYEVYYIQYMDSGNVVRTILLDNEQAYKPATLEDIWYVTNELKPWCFAYVLDEVSYSVILPATPAAPWMAIRYTARSKIEVVSPALIHATTPWFPRITNGSFSWYYGDYSYRYEIPEFKNQSFNPYEPYKVTDRVLGTKISSSLLKLPHERIFDGAFARRLSIVIEENGAVIKALTLDENYIGTRYRDIKGDNVKDEDGNYIVWSDDEILSVDHWFGLVQLGVAIKDYWEIWCSYTYQETYFEVSRLNTNPLFDREVNKQIQVLYLVPRCGPNQNTAQTASIEYLRVGPDGRIEEASQDGTTGNPNVAFVTQRGDPDGYSATGALGLHYNWRASTYITDDFTCGTGEAIPVSSTAKFPHKGWVRFLDNDTIPKWRYVKYTKKTDQTLVLSTEDTEAPTTAFSYVLPSGTPTIELVNFVDQYTISSYRKRQYELDHYGLITGLPSCYGQYFVLSELAINPPHGVRDLARIDVREDGGGIWPDLYDQAKAINPEVQWYFDFLRHDGQPTPGNAVAVIKVPIRLKQLYGEEYIQEVVDNNIALGVMPVIQYYGYQPEIISIATFPTGLLVCWEPMGEEFTYGVWYSTSPDGPWTRHNQIRLTDSGLGDYDKNCYLVDGLELGRRYYVKVTCEDKFDAYWCSCQNYSSTEGGSLREDDAPEYPFGNEVAFSLSVGL